MSTNDKDRATVVLWTSAKDIDGAVEDAQNGCMVGESPAKEDAKEFCIDLWRITITVERIPNEETK